MDKERQAAFQAEYMDHERRMMSLKEREQRAKTDLAEFVLKFTKEQAKILEMPTVKLGQHS